MGKCGKGITNGATNPVTFYEKCAYLPKTRPIAPSYLFSSKGQSPQQNKAEDEDMKTNKRFIKGVVAAAAKEETVMPWARGTRRAAFIAKRNATATERKSA